MTNLEITLLAITSVALIGWIRTWIEVIDMEKLKQPEFMFNPSHVGRRVVCTVQGEGTLIRFKKDLEFVPFRLVIEFDHGQSIKYTSSGAASNFDTPTLTLIKQNADKQ